MLGQTVKTPNGDGIFQHIIWSEGRREVMVSHAPKAEIDADKCESYLYSGGIWQLCGYLETDVS